jgi:hypothetical protein
MPFVGKSNAAVTYRMGHGATRGYLFRVADDGGIAEGERLLASLLRNPAFKRALLRIGRISMAARVSQQDFWKVPSPLWPAAAQDTMMDLIERRSELDRRAFDMRAPRMSAEELRTSREDRAQSERDGRLYRDHLHRMQELIATFGGPADPMVAAPPAVPAPPPPKELGLPAPFVATTWMPQATSNDAERDRIWTQDLDRLREHFDRHRHWPVEAIPEMAPERVVPAKGGSPKRLNLTFNLKPGSNRARQTEDATPERTPSFVSPSVDPVLEKALGKRAAAQFRLMTIELDNHLDLLGSYLGMPSSGDDLRPRLTAASGLLAALDPYVNTVARAGIVADGEPRKEMLRVCAKHQRRHASLRLLTYRAAEAARGFTELFVTGEYER